MRREKSERETESIQRVVCAVKEMRWVIRRGGGHSLDWGVGKALLGTVSFPEISDSQGVVLGPAASASPGNTLKMQIPGLPQTH